MTNVSLIPALIVANFDASLEFYASVLGFQILAQHENPSSAQLELEGSRLMIEAQQPDSWVLGELSHPFGRGLNLQIRCTDVDGLRARIDAAGISVYRDIESKWYEAEGCRVCDRQFLVADPDGYLLRFCQSVAGA